MKAISLILSTGWLLRTAAMAQRFAAMPSPTLSPRYYQPASPVRPLGKRQASLCLAGQHPCNDIGPPGASACCPDDTYCFISPLSAPPLAACCAIGSVCSSPCSESEYQCVVTVTVTTALPPTTTSSPACCPRQCTQTSMFGCPSSLGGGCCSYGQDCASNSQCLWVSSASSTVTAVVSQVPAGCTTGQIACASRLGGGCCAVTQSCTLVAGGEGARCAAVTVTPTASGVVGVPRGGGGLGTGAKAGIGIGVVFGAGVVVGVVTWLVLRRRRRRSSRAGAGSTSDPRTFVGSDSSPRPQQGPRGTGLGVLPGEMTESRSDVVARGGRLRGLTTDYFGPAAVSGPFTEEGGPVSGTTTPPGGNNRNRAVPAEPHSPDDITSPVEIDSRTKQRNVSDTITGRFELVGSELAPPSSEITSPVSPFTPSPGNMNEGALPGSPTLGYASHR